MIKSISTAWKNNLETNIHHEIRAYLNPRGIEYGPISSAGSYVPVVGSDNAPGSYNGYQLNNVYAIPFSAPKTIDILIKPNFAYNAAEYVIMSWVYDTNYVKLGYNHTNARFFVSVYTSSETRVYFGPTFASSATLQVYQRLSICLNGSTVDAYHNASKTSAAFVTTTLKNLPLLNIGGGVNCYINNIRLIPIATLQSDIDNHYKSILNPETFFSFNKTAFGRERCNVTDDMFSYSLDMPGTHRAASASIQLYNLNGQFNDDTFKPLTALLPADDLYPSNTLYPLDVRYDYEPQNGYYNGTATQIYLQRRVGLDLEAWNTYTDINCFETLFLGSIPPGSFARNVSASSLSTISLSADDRMSDIGRKIVRKSRKWEDYYLVSETNLATSLFHVVAKLATEREVYNYLANSGFENTTIANSWTVSGGTISRSTTNKLFGTYACKLNGQSVAQIVTIELSKGERFNYSAYVYTTTPQYVSIKLGELISGASVATSVSSVYHSGNGWQLLNIDHEIVNSSSDRLKCYIEPGTTGDIYIDGCMLVYGDYKPFYIDNTADGTSGVSASTQAVRGYYDYIGIDGDDVTYQHPWAVIREGESVFDFMCKITDATIYRYMYIDRSGVLRFKSNLNTSIGSPLGTIGKAASVSSSVQSDIANKVKVSGVYINKRDNIETVWQVEASNLNSDNSDGSTYQRNISAGGYFPSTTEAPDGYEAKYGDLLDIVSGGVGRMLIDPRAPSGGSMRLPR